MINGIFHRFLSLAWADVWELNWCSRYEFRLKSVDMPLIWCSATVRAALGATQSSNMFAHAVEWDHELMPLRKDIRCLRRNVSSQIAAPSNAILRTINFSYIFCTCVWVWLPLWVCVCVWSSMIDNAQVESIIQCEPRILTVFSRWLFLG